MTTTEVDRDFARLDRRIREFNRALDDLVANAIFVSERSLSLQGVARKMIRDGDACLRQLNPDCGLRSVYVVDAAGEARWTVERF